MSIKKKILFVCYGAGHVNMLVPLIRKAIADVNLEVSVLGLTTAGKVLESNSIPYLGFKELVEDGDQAAISHGEKLAAQLGSNGNVCQEETVAYLGLSFFDLVKKFGSEEAERLYELKGRQAFLPTTVISRLFDRIKPDLLVSTNSPRAERAAFYVARHLDVASICIVGLFAQQEVGWIGEPGYSRKVCVLSSAVKDFIVGAGRDSKEVVVTGNPAFDRLADSRIIERAKAFRKENGWVGKKVILWASQPEPDRHPFTGASGDPLLPRRVEQQLLEICGRHSDWQAVIRYHPGEMIQPADWPRGAYISASEEDLAVLLGSVDVVVTMTSTVGVEGALLGKPLVTIDSSIFRADAPYSEMGLSKGVRDLRDMEVALQEVLSGGWSASDTLPEAGTATDKVFRIMQQLLTT